MYKFVARQLIDELAIRLPVGNGFMGSVLLGGTAFSAYSFIGAFRLHLSSLRQSIPAGILGISSNAAFSLALYRRIGTDVHFNNRPMRNIMIICDSIRFLVQTIPFIVFAVTDETTAERAYFAVNLINLLSWLYNGAWLTIHLFTNKLTAHSNRYAWNE